MYNFNLLKNEELIKVFDNVFIKQEDNKKTTTIALTNKRILFLDYLTLNDYSEVLRISKGMDYLKYKEVYYEINLEELKSIKEQDNYIVFYNDKSFEFNNEELFLILKDKLS